MQTSNNGYALTAPSQNSSLLYRHWYRTQILKYNNQYHEANLIFELVLQAIIKDPNIPHQIFWEMGNLYKGEPSEDEMMGTLNWVKSLTRANSFGPNKSIVSINVNTDSRVCYFCIPLPLLDKKLALYALDRATPVAPVVHRRNENNLAAQIQQKLSQHSANLFGVGEMLMN